MKATTKTSNLTSYFGSQIKASVNELIKVLGKPVYSDNVGDGENFKWVLETDGGKVITVYDITKGKSINDLDGKITWNIGGFNIADTTNAKEEIETMLG